MRFSDKLIGLVLIAFGTWVLFYTRTFPTLEKGYPGPSLFPNVLAVLMMIAGVGLIIQGFKRKQKFLMLETGDLDREGVINILVIVASVIVYIFLAEYIGFLILTPLLLIANMKWLKVSWKWSVIVAVGVTVGIHLLFAKLLLVPLPWGLWGW